MVNPGSCRCNVANNTRLLNNERRALFSNIQFDGEHELDCTTTSTFTKFVVECNDGFDENEYAMSNSVILLILFCVIFFIVAVVFFLKLRKATTELDALKRKMTCPTGTMPPGPDVEIDMKEVGPNNQQE
jgi:hypothetical protein